MAGDPDWAGLKAIDWSEAVLVVPPKKKAISIRVDEDVLDYFKSDGEGYQRRMNAVLRFYMQQKRKKKPRPGSDPIRLKRIRPWIPDFSRDLTPNRFPLRRLISIADSHSLRDTA